jgi:hypothetical protein
VHQVGKKDYYCVRIHGQQNIEIWKFECNVGHLQCSSDEAHLSSKLEASSFTKSHLRFYEITRQGVHLQHISVKA